MEAVLGRTTKELTSPAALVFSVALGVTAVILMICAKPLFGGIPRPAPPAAACLISGPAGLRPLNYVDGLENCGVQLEAVYLEDGQPVTGGYGGVRLFVDDQGIDAAQPGGPRQRLIPGWMRGQIDTELGRLMRVRDTGSAMQVSVVRPGS